MILKLMQYGETYVFGGIHRPVGIEPESQDYLGMVEFLYKMGVDGIKMYDAKPSVRKQLNMALDSPQFEPMYSYLEENDIPVMNHVGDPANFWDGDNAPEIAKQNGWTYDSSYVHPEKYFEEVTNVFMRHPRLKMILAHFFFLSVNMPRLKAFLEKHRNAFIDITPGTEMYIDFSNNPDDWKAFFIEFQDRIIFGTDNGFFGETPYEINAIRTFLETDRTFNAWDMKINGIALPETALRKIYYDNFKSIVKEPRLPDFRLLKEEYETVMKIAEQSALKDKLLEDLRYISEVLVHMGVM
ncbi:MAG: amidohydrolase [Treponema sp.]|nr:amidohydrolase [Treponema sp.]